MMADNIEHVISYWMVFQKFHSPALAGAGVQRHHRRITWIEIGIHWSLGISAAVLLMLSCIALQ